MEGKTCIIPGSFDPMTIGHLSIIAKASKIFDNVVVAILNNSDKVGFLTLAERKEIAEKTCEGLNNVKIITADGLLVDIAKSLNISHIVKGLRNTIDFEYEQNMAKINKALEPNIQTIYIPCDPEFDIISSSFVRELYRHNKKIEMYVHPCAVKIIESK